MRTSLKFASFIAASMICMAGCGNAGAKNEIKKSAATAEEKSLVVELTPETFNTAVYDMEKEDSPYLGKIPAIVDFTATWCGPCQRMAPILDELSIEYKGKVNIYKVDVDKCRDLALSFNISSIPAMLFIPMDGEPVMTVGSRDKETMKKQIETILFAK